MCVFFLFRLLVGNGFDPEWWLGDSRVVKVERSSCDNELTWLSFYGKISESRIRSVILSFCYRKRSRPVPSKEKSGDIHVSYALFRLYRPIGDGIEYMTSQVKMPAMAPRWSSHLVGRPEDAFGVTSRGESTHGKVASRPRVRCRSSMYRGRVSTV